MKTLNLGNNEQISRGMARQHNGEWLAMTYTESKYFKTEAGAVRWLAKRGLKANGEKI